MEPRFLDDETLTDNLDDSKASRVISWLVMVYENSPSELSISLELARGINSITILDNEYFEKLMSQLEAGYEEKI